MALRRWRWWGVAAALLWLSLDPASASELGKSDQLSEYQSVTKTDSGRVQIVASARARVSADQAWSLLTDYDDLTAFMPGIDSSRVIATTDSSQVVRLVMTTRIIVPWTFRLEVEYTPRPGQKVLKFRQVRGSLRTYAGQWEVEPLPGGRQVQVTYKAQARVRRFPWFVISAVVRRQMSQMMPALVGELERRFNSAAEGP